MTPEIEKWQKSLLHPSLPDEFEAGRLIREYGIMVPDAVRLMPSDRPDMDSSLFPCVLKVCTPEIFHKTDVGGVFLNCDRTNIRKRLKRLRLDFPGVPILMEKQEPFMGPEIIIGICQDPLLGPAVMVGAGGILTEVYQDASFRLVPCETNEALHMIDELVLAKVFDNFRGMNLDKQKLAQAVCAVSGLAVDLGGVLSQLDINPIVYSKGQWIALDVKMVLTS